MALAVPVRLDAEDFRGGGGRGACALRAHTKLYDSGMIDVAEDSLLPTLINRATFAGAVVCTSVSVCAQEPTLDPWAYYTEMFVVAVTSFFVCFNIISAVLQPFLSCEAALLVLLSERITEDTMTMSYLYLYVCMRTTSERTTEDIIRV